ncbi:hypothetical protein GCM10010978_07850 [Compostibacillus humi]|uniref:Cupin type-2 domain-containing protein n=1 Tax=Compostibacillus humi TaxID=1245525 RepID=A0A8J2ZQA4_9BACI|nr:cupin domain-containing protein [Compostibacillus humi]GGH71668.1 hypothetical protein GCM10010978_07850 [Compostibacillus humi]
MYYAPFMYVYPAYPAVPLTFRTIRNEQMQDANHLQLNDAGKQPFVVNIEEASVQNQNYRTAIWTGDRLQVTLMSIPPGGDIGLEVHPDTDQFLRIEKGQGLVQMGPREDQLTFQRTVGDDDAIMVPRGTWHNLTNMGAEPLKLYSIYAPPEHPFGTVHTTKQEAMMTERKHY